MKRKIAIEIISFLLVLLFMYAAVSKLIDIEKFKVQISQSPLLVAVKGVVPWAVPGIEILTSFMLMNPTLRLLGMHVAFIIMVVFTAYIVAILTISPSIPCSCGGVLQAMSWKVHLVFNAGITLVAVLGIFLCVKENQKANDNNRVPLH